METADPLKLAAMLWPRESFYPIQREMVYSVEDSAETYVHAANKVGKDWVAGKVITLYLLRHCFIGEPPNRGCRIVTTSASDGHLDVLWGEIGRCIATSAHPLDSRKGGPFVLKDREVNVLIDGVEDAISYVKGMVHKPGTNAETLQGHHARFTLGVSDETSSADDAVHKAFQGWAKRMLFFGNPWPCSNFFYKGCKAGNLVAT
jgi:hypothetical protein